MPTLRCPQKHTMTVTQEELDAGFTCAACGQNMREEHIIADDPPSRTRKSRATSQPVDEEDVSERGGIADIGGTEEDE